MKKTEQGVVLTLATKITLARIFAVPVFVLLFVYYLISVHRGAPNELFRWAALIVFTAAALSDALDGYLARSRNEITRLGRILDPIADKSLLLSAIILLTRPYEFTLPLSFPIWFTLLVVSREMVVILGAFVVHGLTGKVAVTPRIIGKAATFFQMLSVVWILIGSSSPWFYVCLIAAALCTFFSGALYVVDGLRQIESVHDREMSNRE